MPTDARGVADYPDDCQIVNDGDRRDAGRIGWIRLSPAEPSQVQPSPVESSAQILGQPLGGGIVALVSAPVAVLVDAVSYLGSAVLILWIRIAGRTADRGERGSAAAASSEAPETGTSTLAGTSVANVIYNVSQVSLRQAITPEHFLGRMNATMRFLVWGTIPIGSLLGAGLSEVIGVRPTIWISAILGLFAFLPVFVSKVRTVRTIPTEDPDAAPTPG